MSWTIKESNLFAAGGSVSAQVDPGSGGGSRIHVTWNRTGVGLKGRTLVGIVKLSGGNPVAVSIKQGLDKMLESERRSQPGTTPTLTSKDGTPIAYQRSGEGPPLVLVHGTSADHSRWKPVLPAFEEHFTVYAVDRRGRGDSGDSEDCSIEREFEDIAAVVDSIGKPVNLLGRLYGAVCALEAALLTRKNLRKLVLYEPERGSWSGDSWSPTSQPSAGSGGRSPKGRVGVGTPAGTSTWTILTQSEGEYHFTV